MSRSMNQMFKGVIFAAVSTAQQARDEKFSLDNQVEKSREVMLARRWAEAHPPIIIPGESRTELISLSDAAREIEEIATLLALAQSGAINLVVLYDFNRFRVLIDQIGRYLSVYRCQLYSVNQPVDPLPPDRFEEQDNDASRMVRTMASLQSDLGISAMRRNYKSHMPKRVTEKGLPYHRIPYGYCKPSGKEKDSDAIPVKVMGQCLVLQQMRDWYFSGLSANEIGAKLRELGVPSPSGHGKWGPGVVLDILCSPFYAGYVYHGLTKTRKNPVTRKIVRKHTGTIVLGKGKHEPLWSEETWRALAKRRRDIAVDRIGKTRGTTKFSHLVRCAICGYALNGQTTHKRSATNKYLYICRQGQNHGGVGEAQLRESVREAIQAVLSGAETIDAPEVVDYTVEIDGLRKLMAEVPNKRARYQRLFAAELMTIEELDERLSEIDLESKAHTTRLVELEKCQYDSTFRAGQTDRLAELLADYDQIMTGPEALANARLSQIIDHIVATRKKVIKIVFK